MSAQTNFNDNYPQYVLYYCNFANADPTLYKQDLSEICTVTYSMGQITLSNWLLGAYPMPSNATLIGYALTTVNDWFNWFYTKPEEIEAAQYYMISTTDLAKVRVDPSMIGYSVMDSTTRTTKTYNGTSWVENRSELVPPSILTITSSTSSAIAFATANVAQMINMSGFTQSNNPRGDFTFNAATGQATYTGATTQWFRVRITYTSTKLIPLVSQTFTTYVAKNSSTTVPGDKITDHFQHLE